MIRAYVQENLPSASVSVFLIEGDERDSRRILRHLGDDVWESEPLPEAVTVEPSFRLSESGARALLDALSAHYAGSSDVRQLRSDYDAERARVDKLIAALLTPPAEVIRHV
jgi:hypothetical protein